VNGILSRFGLRKRTVPLFDTDGADRALERELRPALRKVIETRSFILGPAVAKFERAFAAYCEARHAIAVGSGTDALHVAVLAHGVGPGDEVITQANTFVATLEAIAYTGARIVLVDVAPPSYDIDVDAVARAITPRTKAIVPVHLYGQPAPLDALGVLAETHGIAIVEDASQAHGARFRGRRVGSLNTTAFSFYPEKNLGAFGEGGGVTTNDDGVAERIRRLRNHGSDNGCVHEEVGYNYRMDGFQGAVLGVKLGHLDRWNAARRTAAARYDTLLGDWPRPRTPSHVEHVHHLYPVFVRDRDRVIDAMRARGVQTRAHYPVGCHLQPAFASLGYREGSFPHTERVAREVLSLPMFPHISPQSIRYVSETLQRVAAGR
jgi:dTDP-4-amino-4,6-dideoxygalactose transaminase